MKNMIRKVQQMPNLPQPYSMRDWRKVALDYDRLVFDFHAQGDFLPLPWMDDSHINTEKDVIGLPSYINSKKCRQNGRQEGINIMAAVLGASACGVDKSHQNGLDFVDMLENFFSPREGEQVFLNTFTNQSGHTFWYETYPNLLMAAISYFYHVDWLEEKLRLAADRYVAAVEAMGGEKADFWHTAFSFSKMETTDNGVWCEPEAAAGYAFVLYSAYRKFGKESYLDACKKSMDFLARCEKNPYYELLLPYGVYVAARLNREHGCHYPIEKIVNWCFDGDSDCRFGWGVIAERWGDYDCYGLCGSLTDWGQRWDLINDANSSREVDPVKSGYAFAGNTFSMAAGILSAVRYDPRLAHDAGKWFLNAANASRLFYQNAHGPKSQSCAFFTDDPDYCIAYEGLRKYWDGMSPYATGDPIRYSWGSIDLGLYGSSHVGMFGAVYGSTDVEGILCLNCGAVDFIDSDCGETRLLYNPYPEAKTVHLNGLPQGCWTDAVSGKKLGCTQDGQLSVSIPEDGAVLAVLEKENP